MTVCKPLLVTGNECFAAKIDVPQFEVNEQRELNKALASKSDSGADSNIALPLSTFVTHTTAYSLGHMFLSVQASRDTEKESFG